MTRPPLFVFIGFLLFSWSSAVEFSMCEIGDSKECYNLKQAIKGGHTLKCVESPNIYRCMQMVKDGKVDVLGVSDTDLYPAGKFLDLKPFLQEVLDNDQTYRYKAVFLIKDGSSIKNLDSLKDKKSCHTGAGKTTGWTVPVSNLQKLKKIEIKTCYDTVANVANLFAESCIPGAMTPRFNPFNTNRPAACGLCGSCEINSPYSGYDGALKCLLENKGDIAFVSNKQLGANSSLSLLCRDGTVKNQSEYESCNWATRPSDVFVSSPKITSSKLADITKALQDNADNIRSQLDIFKDSKSFKKTEESYKKIMGDGFFNTFEYYHTCEEDLKWCTVSDAEMKKCSDLKLAFAAKRATNKLKCVKGTDARDCINTVSKGDADFVVLDGGLIGDAQKDAKCKIKAGISENHILNNNAKEASYYAVAVVKKTSTLKFPDLKDAKSCHTGYGKTSGWKVPIGLLISKEKIKNDKIAYNVGKYFSKSCVPGALDGKNNPDGDNPKSLCELCPDDGKECSASAKNKYYGYTGAFRCLVEKGDVAFVKHTTVLESTDTKGKEDWEKDLKSEDFELLCSDGTRASVKSWLTCHLAKVPAHAMVFNTDKEKTKRMYSVFSYMDLASKETKDLLFKSNEGKNLLFKDSAIGLSYIEEPDNFISPEYKKILKEFGSDEKICSSTATTLYGTLTLLLITIITIFF